MIIDLTHQHTAHCESGVMSTMLKHNGLDISEPMVVGLSSSLTFAYLPFIKISGFPLIAYRMPPRRIIKGIQKRVGLKICFKKFSDPEHGMAVLDQRLDQGKIVGLQTSVYWLPYFPANMRFHFNAHNLIIYGKEGDEYLISDPVFEAPVRCHYDHLKKSRFAKGTLAPKGMMYHLEYTPNSIDWEKAIPQAIKKNIRIMSAPIPIIGIRGFHFLANKLAKLEKQLQDPQRIKSYIGHIIRMQEEIGTGGAGFRFIYASFLQEASRMMNNNKLEEASEMMTYAGDQLRNFALETVKMCKDRKKLNMKDLSEQLHRYANEELKVWQFLKKLY